MGRKLIDRKDAVFAAVLASGITLVIAWFFAFGLSVFMPRSYFLNPEDLANFSIGMSESLCIEANGPPDEIVEGTGAIVGTRGYYPPPERTVEQRALIYRRVTYCVVVFINDEGICNYIHVGLT